MKNFKTADLSLQVIVVLVCLVLIASDQMEFYRACFITGGSQLLSMIVHEFLRSFTAKGTPRRVYHNISYAIAACMALTPLVYFTGIVFFPMLLLAPFMAAYYIYLCYRETFFYLKRPLSVLK